MNGLSDGMEGSFPSYNFLDLSPEPILFLSVNKMASNTRQHGQLIQGVLKTTYQFYFFFSL